MKVKVKLFANLRENREKEILMELAEGSVVGDIVEKLDIARDDLAIIMINGRSVQIDMEIKERDEIALFPPVGGG